MLLNMYPQHSPVRGGHSLQTILRTFSVSVSLDFGLHLLWNLLADFEVT
jgi:hypothetical protein